MDGLDADKRPCWSWLLLAIWVHFKEYFWHSCRYLYLILFDSNRSFELNVFELFGKNCISLKFIACLDHWVLPCTGGVRFALPYISDIWFLEAWWQFRRKRVRIMQDCLHESRESIITSLPLKSGIARSLVCCPTPWGCSPHGCYPMACYPHPWMIDVTPSDFCTLWFVTPAPDGCYINPPPLRLVPHGCHPPIPPLTSN